MNYLYSFRALRTGGPKLRTIDTKFPTFCKEGLHVRGGPKPLPISGTYRKLQEFTERQSEDFFEKKCETAVFLLPLPQTERSP